MKSKFLFHPKVTLAAVVAALASMAASCGAFVAALDPLLKLAFLAPYVGFIKRVDGDLVTAGACFLAASGVLTAVAGAGRSFVSAVDAGPTK
jgi:hypothetical protein